MRILMTFAGNRDPDYEHSRTKKRMAGPILTLLRHMGTKQKFDVIELFFTNDGAEMKEKASGVEKTVCQMYPAMKVNFQPVDLPDPTSYRAIMSKLRQCHRVIVEKYCAADYFIYLSPGTPQMQSSWLLLVASGEISAKLLQMRDPEQQKEGQSALEEIDPQSNWFPRVFVERHDLIVSPSINPDEFEQAREAAQLHGSQGTLQYIHDSVAKAAQTDASFLISGESGTGKEVLAKFIHKMSPRKKHDFVSVNCAALPENLIESELFGYVKGAFTGAYKDKAGLFKRADNGTLFLDEIGDMPLNVQVKILRAIEEREIRPVGGLAAIKVDVRIIAATNQNLPQFIREKKFRNDLFYRLNRIPIVLKPLRERRQDIGILAKHFINKYNRATGVQKVLTPESIQVLCNRSWPGNIRELDNVLERAHIYADGEKIEPCHLDEEPDSASGAFSLPSFEDGFDVRDHLARYRTAIYQKALKEAKNDAEAAHLLGITQVMVSKFKKKSLTRV